MSFRSTLLAATAIFASAKAHITMEQPVPYSVDKLDNGPITAEQYPCKSQNGFTVSTMNNMAVGEQQEISFKGTAVHGGGSCQLSVTMDTEPNADSVFKVIKSIEGGCPGVDGGAQKYQFELPESIPNGKATFAWTWFAKLSGGPEMYMNCAPIEVTGGASDDSAFNELPDMLIANIASTTCKSPANEALKFPNPGQSLETGNTGDVQDPTGECGATGNSPPPEGGAPSASAPGGQPATSAPAGQPEPSAPVGQPGPSSPAGQPQPAPSSPAGPPAGQPATSIAGGQPGPAPSNSGGVFAPGASSAAPVPGQSTQTTLVTVTAAPSGPVAQPTPPAGTGSPAQPTAQPGSPSGGGGSCSENGAVVCNGPTQFGLCNNGQVVWQEVAAGTTCTDGVIQKKRDVRLPFNGRIARPRAARKY